MLLQSFHKFNIHDIKKFAHINCKWVRSIDKNGQKFINCKFMTVLKHFFNELIPNIILCHFKSNQEFSPISNRFWILCILNYFEEMIVQKCLEFFILKKRLSIHFNKTLIKEILNFVFIIKWIIHVSFKKLFNKFNVHLSSFEV